MSNQSQAMSKEDQAIQQIKKGFAETVLFDMTQTFGADAQVDMHACELVDLSGEDGVYGILSHELQTLVGVTSDAEYLLKNHPVGTPDGDDLLSQQLWEDDHLPNSKKGR